MPHLKTAALSIWVDAGSRNEEAHEQGIAHFLEHMAFKGTRRRTAAQIAEEIEAVGGDLNASTGAENTGFYARVLGADLSLAADILTDILTGARFDPGELAREQGVVIQEIGAAYDTPDDFVFDLFQARAFPDQPIGRSILGTVDTVRAFTPDALRDYLSRHYRAPNMVVSAAGDVDHDAFVREIGERLAGLSADAAPAAPAARYIGGREIGVRELEQTHLVFGLEGCSYLDPRRFAVQVFASVLGGGSSSRLFQEAREKRGLCYSINAYHQPFADTGILTVYAGTDPADTRDLMALVVDELASTAATAHEAEIGRAKAMMKVGLLGMLESSAARADQLARHVLAYGRPIPLVELVAKIEAVTVEDVRAAGRALLDSGRPTFAGLGPGPGLESAARIVENLEREAA
jgi:predicted Zn-dependent peptidase